MKIFLPMNSQDLDFKTQVTYLKEKDEFILKVNLIELNIELQIIFKCSEVWVACQSETAFVILKCLFCFKNMNCFKMVKYSC